jgi:superfamily II DNA or RNA helicase
MALQDTDGRKAFTRRGYQQTMIDKALAAYQQGLGGFWWLAGCSTGKTWTSLQLMTELGFNRVFVMTTVGAATDAWLTTVTEHSDYEYIFIDGTPTQREKALKRLPERFVAVSSYSSAWRTQMPQFEAVIADESHKLQSWNSKISLWAAKQRPKFKLNMTGTAFDSKLTAAYGQMGFINPMVLGGHNSKDYNRFFDRFVNWYSTPDKPYVKIPQKKNPYKNHDKLAELLAPYLYRVDSEEVLDLPDQQDIIRHVVLEPSIRKAYNKFKKEYITELGDEVITASNAGVLAMRLHQLVGSYSPKVAMTLEILEEIDHQPCVIFVRFKDEVAALEKAIHAAGYTTLKVTGEAHQHVEFQRGEGDVCIVNIDAGAEGIDLTRARYAIYYSVGYDRNKYIQSRYRVRRSNSEAEKVTFFHLVARGTVDEAIYKTLAGKEDEAETLLTELQKVWYNTSD